MLSFESHLITLFLACPHPDFGTVPTNQSQRFGRLNVSGTVLSKRKINKLIETACVRDWDDPRLYTLIALRRGGVPPGAILAFVNELGVTKAESTIDIRRFEQVVRKYLENMFLALC